MSVIHEYTEDVVERRTRTVHVLEHRRARIHAWHGGVRVTDLGYEGSVPLAVEVATKFARRMGVGPGSTMRIRVEEQADITRRVVSETDGGRARYEPGDSAVSMASLRRHAWDVVSGEMPVTWSGWTFSTEEWFGFRDRLADPALVAAGYVGLSLETRDVEALYGGCGHGRVAFGGVAVEEADPPGWIRDGRGMSGFLRVTLRGTVPVATPPGGTPSDALAFLATCRVSSECDRSGMGILRELYPGHARWSDPSGTDPGWSPVAKALAHATA